MRKIEKEILTAVDATPEVEVCGFVVKQGGKDVVRVVENVADEPKHTFEIAPEDWSDIEDRGGDIQVVWHSHPEGVRTLSTADRRNQVETQLPWWVVANGEIHKYPCVPHLIGRQFDYGKFDCMALLRDAYLLAGIELPNPERMDYHTDLKNSRFVEAALAHGFTRVDERQPGDAVLYSSGGEANHVAVYLGDGIILHHAVGTLSRRDLMTQYWEERIHSIWRHKDWQDWRMKGILADLELSHV